jgi:hypothetical protein
MRPVQTGRHGYDASWLNNIKVKEMTKTTEKKVKHEKKVSQK